MKTLLFTLALFCSITAVAQFPFTSSTKESLLLNSNNIVALVPDHGTAVLDSTKHSITLQYNVVKLSFWKDASGYTFSSAVGNIESLMPVWLKWFDAAANTDSIKINGNGKTIEIKKDDNHSYVLSVTKRRTLWSIDCRLYDWH